METIYPGITLKELREVMKEHKGKFKLVKVSAYDGWRYALYNKKYNYRCNVQKIAGVIQASY